MDDGYSIALGSVYQGGCWDVVDDINNGNSVPAVFKSTDNGTNWQRTQLAAVTGNICAVVMHPTNKNVLYAGGSTKDASSNDVMALFKTTNGGTNWNPITVATPGTGIINAILFNPLNANSMYLATTKGVYTTTNGGTIWQAPTTAASIICLVHDPKTANKVYAGGSSGVYVTTNAGTNWTLMNAGLTNTDVRCLEADGVNNVLYAGIAGRGTFRISIATGVEDRTPVETPKRFALYQNYPNPFNASTSIRFVLTRKEDVSITVCDAAGRMIAQLARGQFDAGEHAVVWNGRTAESREASSGMYIIVLNTPSFREARKALLMK